MRPQNSVLGINAYHGDSSACLVVDGVVVAAAEEERFRRIKHWAGFPAEAARWCLREGGVAPTELGHVAINRDPRANLIPKLAYALRRRPSPRLVLDRLRNRKKVADLRTALAQALEVPLADLRAHAHYVEHHRAHLASAFFVSPLEDATVVSVDGFGDFASAAWGVGRGSSLTVEGQVRFPHSLGLLYLAVTQFLGFPNYGDEYKVMGLAPYGEPRYADSLRRLVKLLPNGGFELVLPYFRHHSEGVEMEWEDGEPRLGPAFSSSMAELLGPARDPAEPVGQRHKDLAASLQCVYEDAFFHLLNKTFERHANPRLCLAGGCAMNSVANGKIAERTPFRETYIQSAAGDAGGALGAAMSVWNERLGGARNYVMRHAYLGPEWSGDEFRGNIAREQDRLNAAGCAVERMGSSKELCERTAASIADGKVVGWFQGRMEWGPRALGNRSILADPRRSDMRELLNLKIKHREGFRPFAPSILRENVAEWFQTEGDVPFMLQVLPVRADKRTEIPAVTHVDGSGRLQTVTQEANGIYHELISAFAKRTGVPVLLNTSFNENEPVVCRPEEALDCFLRTNMDVLVLGEHFIERQAA